MMHRYVVTDKGPIDRQQPGTVANYDEETAERLCDEGYLVLQTLIDGEWLTWPAEPDSGHESDEVENGA